MRLNALFLNAWLASTAFSLCLQSAAVAGPTEGTKPAKPASENAATAGGGADAAFTDEARNQVDFFFEGGNLFSFVQEVDRQYHVDWRKVADMPGNMGQAHVPALRLSPARARAATSSSGVRTGDGSRPPGESGAGGAGVRTGPCQALVALYNSLREAHPDLGILKVEGDFVKPSLVLFQSIAPRPGAQEGPPVVFKMKAITLSGIPRVQWDKVGNVIKEESYRLAEIRKASESAGNAGPTWHNSQLGGAAPVLSVQILDEVGLLIVIAPDPFIQGAESIVDAWPKNQQPEPPLSNPAAK